MLKGPHAHIANSGRIVNPRKIKTRFNPSLVRLADFLTAVDQLIMEFPNYTPESMHCGITLSATIRFLRLGQLCFAMEAWNRHPTIVDDASFSIYYAEDRRTARNLLRKVGAVLHRDTKPI